jgi:hypothetical protein
MKVMKEYDLGWAGKSAAVVAVVMLAIAALLNLSRGEAPHPGAFSITLAGLALFAVAKLSVILRTRLVSFGPRLMSPAMANLYRAGYWLMAVGIIATFA